MCGKIQVNKLYSWFQTTHNKDIYQWITHKYKSTNSLKQETYKVTKNKYIYKLINHKFK